MIEAYNPAFGADVDPEAPAELVPKSGEFGIEQHQYSTVVMFQGPFEPPAQEPQRRPVRHHGRAGDRASTTCGTARG